MSSQWTTSARKPLLIAIVGVVIFAVLILFVMATQPESPEASFESLFEPIPTASDIGDGSFINGLYSDDASVVLMTLAGIRLIASDLSPAACQQLIEWACSSKFDKKRLGPLWQQTAWLAGNVMETELVRAIGKRCHDDDAFSGSACCDALLTALHRIADAYPDSSTGLDCQELSHALQSASAPRGVNLSNESASE